MLDPLRIDGSKTLSPRIWQPPSAGTCNKRSAKSLELSEVPVTFANRYLERQDKGSRGEFNAKTLGCTPPKTLRHLLYVTYIYMYIYIFNIYYIVSTHMYRLTYLLTCPKKSSTSHAIPMVSSMRSPWSLILPPWRTWHPQVSRPQRCLATDSAFRRANRA